MILLIDNYDSFVYNLMHFMGELGADIEVRRNDELGADEAMALQPDAIVISPGPCDPDKA
ncbi:MAG: aminodeoxychorismate/anthranilate synthase component II, partial [Alphaproteobacteria bacterium]|nr:aminodeoxychorismate/anthranilate synthase component II [Alphaproteobacteria bacterium]